MRTICLFGGGLKRPSFLAVDPRGVGGPYFWCFSLRPEAQKGRSLRSWLCLLSAAALPWRLAEINAASSFLQCAGPSGQGRDAAGPPGTQPAAGRPACTTLLALLPSEPQTLPCPCLLHVDTSPGLCGVHAQWARLGQDPVSSQSAWMMLLKHNM